MILYRDAKSDFKPIKCNCEFSLRFYEEFNCNFVNFNIKK